ncbi:hypothetical protein AWB78_04852 [Caballeronia calidae]|uniref:Transmembrane protein n=1 Tax=Caballeronia calidae TaxID=1777139 RepID=A0A158D8H1_9BURK|nr:hypothetical protein [Caballeronia calidae]SAK90660.1 hypothetical protein AWB78_04852 [Caballeronia calidae]
MTEYEIKRKKLVRRFAVGYLGILGMVVVALVFSVAQGAGWKPILVGAPVYLTFFVAVSYQFIKELRSLKREEQEAASKESKQ